MSWHYSQALVEEYLEENSSDGELFVPLSMNPQQQVYSSSDKMIEFCRLSLSGMMCEPLTESRGEELLTWFLAASPARTSPFVGMGLASMEKEAAFGWKWEGSLAKYYPVSSSWKTRQLSLLGGLDELSETWPAWGMVVDGELLGQTPLVPQIEEKGFGWLLTPTAQGWKAWTFRNPYALIRKNHADGNLQEQLMRVYKRMITPETEEIMLMWPEQWTDLKPLGTDKIHSWRQRHLSC